MKKILLSVAAVFAAMSVNAQEIAVIDADAIGIGADAVELAAGTELMKTESVTCSILFTDNFKATGLSENNVTVNDVDFGSTTGIQGSTNPPAAATEGTYPEQGCIYSFVPSKDGFLYVIHKASAILEVSVLVTFILLILLLCVEDVGLMDAAYEMFSATATVGLSRGLTPCLHRAGRLIVIVAMYLGRIGPISMALFFNQGGNNERNNINFAKGNFFVG